ncbi:manganese-dependent inorganic pyrophosphatase [Desulfosporosinus sp.]|uniref:manganese-dependent inorganic pyrophosphatase n=1 Tax=Desulfosporosinus sp. TaxID=157907 RepID=UPI000E82FD8E|nr:manganese-dependent inorganic pyrophosphatase [Desulfosporosinus sp.]MBC2722444.1 manganese-dependent inorganic pyrophosphatase [Desulfosporosinus sp.]MBC2726127.1 manganese-dependent inorganic pyrophosphatase [Desulfosporosinus sp.]HBV87496.1 manganese-dependent inorganic pyrophosphatase [Desulfosporosinus sp.]
MSDKIYIVGHKSPDTDSVCSAIALARLKELSGIANVVPCSAGKINKETEYVLNFYGVAIPEVLESIEAGEKLVLVDHNEWGQAVAGGDQAKLIEVIDHHKIGGLQTSDPIHIRIEPVGSTCTIVAKAYKEQGLVPEKPIAGILLAAILSDTVIFKSPTCTDEDKAIAAELAAIAGVEPKTFGIDMFKSASNIADRTPQSMIEEDLKAFTMGPHKIGVGQVSLMGMEGFEDVRANLTAAIEAHRAANDMKYLCLMVTDILEDYTELIVKGDNPEEVAKAFGKELVNGSVPLPGVLSRKKQVVPQMTTYFQG